VNRLSLQKNFQNIKNTKLKNSNLISFHLRPHNRWIIRAKSKKIKHHRN